MKHYPNSTKKVLSSLVSLLATLLLLSALDGCDQNPVHRSRVVVIQPLGEFPVHELNKVQEQIKRLHSQVVVRPSIEIPATAYYEPRHRYRADSLIRYLKQYGNADTVVIGLISRDISTTKGGIKDWGVMGLGYNPGYSCVVSTFRLSRTNKEDQFYKVAIHELGHTQGLPHCVEKSCFMRDAEGGNPLDEEHDFCKSCKSFLMDKGWHLP
ncbi:hypothetical protein [Paraflavitalea sp. CAU 1676]|uniref:hypothetical protein n=1 Tax=Paraflavitalea sp. CAU 1676 TaxID=3032598 RepID=UPI0023DCA704|nr:hypothetical protein [Paraflavitalea sp. CAU 1676]MDF2189248.1 hypothetical protein [Paraflavitalea sp. CAU 1676]